MNKQVGNMQFMQKINRLKVLNFVRKNPDCSRPIIAKETGLSLPSITNIVTHLSELGYLKECGTEDVERVGRKSALLRFSPENGKFLCAFLFDETVNIFVCDLSGKASSEYEFSRIGLSLSETISLVCDKVQAITKEYGEKTFLAIGIATSGLVLKNGQFIMSSKLKWKSYNIKEAIEGITNIPVFVENISPIRALYHFRSDEKYNENTIFIDLENGIGAYQFYNGQLNHSALGELGHTTVEPSGEECFCGNRGCLEAMCSPSRLLSLYEKETGEKISLPRLEELYLEKDETAKAVVQNCANYLGMGLANLINLFNPSILVINTGDFKDCPSLTKEATEELYRRAISTLTQNLKIETTHSSQKSVVFGMALNLCDNVFSTDYPYDII